MFRMFTFFFIVLSLILTNTVISSDEVDKYVPAKNLLTEKTRSMLNAIKLAELNEDWETYENLRLDFIQEIKQSNPELAKSYRTLQSDFDDFDNIDGDMNNTAPSNSHEIKDEEFPSQTIPEKWENDVSFRVGKFFRDFSMDVSADNHIYVSVATNNAAPIPDSLIIYRSLDGGITWDYWLSRTVGDGDYNKTEILCFDSPSGGKYILLFFTYSYTLAHHIFKVVQYHQSDASIGGSATLVDSLVWDFAVDRNFPSANYRAMAIYDSATYLYSIRSEPTSYGTIWQDKYLIFPYCWHDLDMCYGLYGSVYATYHRSNNLGLELRENLYFADPASWSSSTTLQSGGSADTYNSEVIATREEQSTIKVQVIYAKREATYARQLYRAYKDDGGAWSLDNAFVTSPTSSSYTYPSLYIKTEIGNKEIHCAYKHAATDVGYKFDDGVSSSWTNTQIVNDYSATWDLKPYVAEVNGEPVVVYAGWGPNTLYCDNNGWVSSITGNETGIVKEFSLSQNHPNPFNPSTTIRYQIANSKPQSTTLQIFNSLGQLVRTLVNTEQSQGEYSVVWNGLDNSDNAVSSGIYYYKLVHGDFVSSRKLIKLK